MIDGHVHVWTLEAERYPWQPTLKSVPIPTRPASAEALIGLMDGAGVTHSVLVQPSVYGWDNSYLCDSLDRWPDRFIGVCLVDPRGSDSGEKLDYWCRERGCRGVRVNLIAEPDAEWILAPERSQLWQSAARNDASVSLQMRPSHISAVVRLAERWPDVTFVVDYLGPEAFHDGTGEPALAAIAGLQNVHYKILALGQDSQRPYPYADLFALYGVAIKHLGRDRLIFGTDYPHILDHCSYRDGIDWLAKVYDIDDDDRLAIGVRNARRLWRIES